MDYLVSSALMMIGSIWFHCMSSLLCSFSLIVSGNVMPVASSTTSMSTATGPGSRSCTPPAGINGRLSRIVHELCMPADLPGHGIIIVQVLSEL
jgi:hypothetical protein